MKHRFINKIKSIVLAGFFMSSCAGHGRATQKNIVSITPVQGVIVGASVVGALVGLCIGALGHKIYKNRKEKEDTQLKAELGDWENFIDMENIDIDEFKKQKKELENELRTQLNALLNGINTYLDYIKNPSGLPSLIYHQYEKLAQDIKDSIRENLKELNKGPQIMTTIKILEDVHKIYEKVTKINIRYMLYTESTLKIPYLKSKKQFQLYFKLTTFESLLKNRALGWLQVKLKDFELDFDDKGFNNYTLTEYIDRLKRCSNSNIRQEVETNFKRINKNINFVKTKVFRMLSNNGISMSPQRDFASSGGSN